MGGATTSTSTWRLVALIPSPLPLLRPSSSSLLLLRRRRRSSLLPPLPPSFYHLPKFSCSNHFHSHSQSQQPLHQQISIGSSFPTPTDNDTPNYYHHPHSHPHPWPEFVKFVTWLSSSGYFNAHAPAHAPLDVKHFLGAQQQQLDDHFLRVANASFAFARDHPTLLWSLPREHIEVVVANGSPSPLLFVHGSAAAARMKLFLGDRFHNVLSKSDEPKTADLMEFLLSYALMALGYSEDMQILSRVEPSVRKLFSELANFEGTSTESVATVQKQLSDGYAKAPMSFDKNVEKKKGDWTCPRCSFMNFARNSHCLQCEEHRPKKFLLGGEWECPQCNFCNFGRNVVCLRCDCKKPPVNLKSDSGWRVDMPFVKDNINTKKINSGVEEQRWFTKITELERYSDMSGALANQDMPETMKAGDNRFDTNHTIARSSGIIDSPIQSNLQTTVGENDINVNISQSFEKDIGQNTSMYMSNNSDLVNKSSAMFGPETDVPTQQQMSDEKYSSQLETKDNESDQETMPMRKGHNQYVVSKKKDRSLSSPMYKRRLAMEEAGKNNYVPFAPFPAGYFAKDKPKEGFESTQSNQQTGAMSLDSGLTGGEKKDESWNLTSNNVNRTPKFDSHLNSPNNNFESHSLSENASVDDFWGERTLEGSAVKESDPLDMSEEAKAERWFRRVAQIKDISELSQIPDEDFPSIMPMRKGVNRFVVSKRKTPLERRLTSSQYRRNLPVEGSDPVRKETDSD